MAFIRFSVVKNLIPFIKRLNTLIKPKKLYSFGNKAIHTF